MRQKQTPPKSRTLTNAPDLRIKYWPIDKIRPRQRQLRKHPESQIERLLTIITKIGFLQAILVDAQGRVIAGHLRLECARRLGMDLIPVIVIGHLSEAEIRAFIMADNRIAELASWDDDILRIELSEVEIELGDDVVLTGFSLPEIDARIHDSDFALSDPADAVVPAPSERLPITQLSDLWFIAQHRLVCGDARNLEVLRRLMGGECAAMVLADPPYNVAIPGNVSGKGKVQHGNFAVASGEMDIPAFTAFNEAWLASVAAVARSGALLYSFMDGRHLRELLNAGAASGLSLVALCCWGKSNAGMGSFYRSQIEHVAVFKSGTAAAINNIQLGRHGRNRSNLWLHPGLNAFGRDRDEALAAHPTIKPVSLLAEVILDASQRGDVVLDPFSGAGSSIIAAHRTGRVGYGVEIDPVFVDVALERLSAVLGIDPVRQSDGASFAALKAAQRAEELKLENEPD